MSPSDFPAPGFPELPAGRVAVRMPNWIGDAVLALPALRALVRRAAAGGSVIELHARRGVAEVLRGCEPIAARVTDAGRPTPGGLLADARALAGAAAAVLLPGSFASALPPWLARVPIRAGLARDGRSPLLTHPLARPRAHHQAAWYLELVGAPGTPRPADLALVATPGARLAALRLAGPGEYAVLVPGAAFGGAKRWPAADFAALGRALAGDGLEPLVLGTAGERELAAGVAAAAGGRSLAGVTDGAAFAGLLAGARLAVTNDSGALHLAAALAVPVLALFGATDPAATGPVADHARVLYHRVACSPCGLRECNRARHECMDAIPAAAAIAAARALLERDPSRVAGRDR